jgi:chromosome partitioning protein
LWSGTKDYPAPEIDTDQQGTLSRWHYRREAKRPERAEVALAELEATLPAIAGEGVQFCCIDTAPIFKV